jgi:hypothetical protein
MTFHQFVARVGGGGVIVSNAQIIGRVGGLAVALGIGAAVAATPWLASASITGTWGAW